MAKSRGVAEACQFQREGRGSLGQSQRTGRGLAEGRVHEDDFPSKGRGFLEGREPVRQLLRKGRGYSEGVEPRRRGGATRKAVSGCGAWLR